MLEQEELATTLSAVVNRTSFYMRTVLFSALSGWALGVMVATKSTSKERMNKSYGNSEK